MASLVALLLALATFWLATVAAMASQGTTQSGQVQSVAVAPTSTAASQATTIQLATSLSKTDGSKASPPVEMDMQLPTGMVRSPGLYPTCAQSTLEQQGPTGCPQGAQIGGGSLVVDARPVLADPVNGLITAFNGTNGTVLLFVKPDRPPTSVIVGNPVSGGLNFGIPLIPTLPGAPDATVTQVTLDLGTGGYFVNPGTQCTQGWAYGFDFTYQNGEKLSLSHTVSCTPITPTIAAPPAPAPVSQQGPPPQIGCVVPGVHGLSLAKAKKKLSAAGCRYRISGKGRVASTSPRAGTRTTKTVLVKAKGKAHKRKGKNHKRKRHKRKRH